MLDRKAFQTVVIADETELNLRAYACKGGEPDHQQACLSAGLAAAVTVRPVLARKSHDPSDKPKYCQDRTACIRASTILGRAALLHNGSGARISSELFCDLTHARLKSHLRMRVSAIPSTPVLMHMPHYLVRLR